MSSTDILLIQYPGISSKCTMSPPCAKVHLALRYKGLPYHIYNCRTPGDIKKFNARGRVPALKIEDQIYVDSSDILTEIDRRWPDPPLLPSSAKLRAQCLLLEDWADEVIYFYGVYLRWMIPESFAQMREATFNKLPWPMRSIVPRVAKKMVTTRLKGQGTGLKSVGTVRAEFFERLDMLEDLLDGEQFLCGEQLTRADLAVLGLVDQMAHPELPPDLSHEVEARPNLVAWQTRVHKLVPSAAG
jgi:glutathione S-transferase